MVAPRLNLGGGGSERQTIALANGFAREGCEVTVSAYGYKGGPDLSAFKRGQGRFLQLALEFLFKIPLHLQNRKNGKTRYSLQQVLDNKTGDDFCGQGSRHQDSRSRSQQHKAKLATLAARSKKRHRVRQGLLLQDGGFCNSPVACRKKSLSRLGVREKTQTVHNGIEIERIEKRSKEEAMHRWFYEEIPVAVSVGRLVPSKGYENLVKTLSVVNGVTPLRFLLIGDGPLRGKIDSQSEGTRRGRQNRLYGFYFQPSQIRRKMQYFHLLLAV